MSERYRVLVQVSGAGAAGETVLWEGGLEELRAKFGDDPEADPIFSSDAAAFMTQRNVVQILTRDGWRDCVDPRNRPHGRDANDEAMSSDSFPSSDNIVPLHGLRAGAEALRTGGLVEKTTVTLRLIGDDLDPPALTRRLGREPTHAHRRGEPRTGAESKIPYSSGAWLFSVEAQRPEGPEEATERLLDQLPSDERLWADLSERHDLSISYGIFFRGWNRGFALSHRLQQRLAICHARLEYDLYADESRSENFFAP